MNISVFIHGMNIPMVQYKCCDAKKPAQGSPPIQAAFLLLLLLLLFLFDLMEQSSILTCLLLADIFKLP